MANSVTNCNQDNVWLQISLDYLKYAIDYIWLWLQINDNPRSGYNDISNCK